MQPNQQQPADSLIEPPITGIPLHLISCLAAETMLLFLPSLLTRQQVLRRAAASLQDNFLKKIIMTLPSA